jgi:hypothetical protein
MGSAVPEPPKQPINGRSNVYRLSSGETDAWVLFDHSIWVEPIQQFAIGVPDLTIAELMERHFLPSNRLQFSSDPLLFRWAEETVLVDTGIGTQMPGIVGLLPAASCGFEYPPRRNQCGANDPFARRSYWRRL